MNAISLRRKTKPPTKTRPIHFTNDGVRRYCTGRKAGRDSLTREWSCVTCDTCFYVRRNETGNRPSFASKGLAILCPTVGLTVVLGILLTVIVEQAASELGELLFPLLVFGSMLIFGLALLRYNCKRGWWLRFKNRRCHHSFSLLLILYIGLLFSLGYPKHL